MKMQMNAYRWLAEPALPVAGLGTYKPQSYQPIQFPKAVSWDEEQFPPIKVGIRGIFGAHTSFSDGAGSVADYVKAAKAAGLSFIVFNDSLERLTPETMATLKADCDAASKAGDFYACPGIDAHRWHWQSLGFVGRKGRLSRQVVPRKRLYLSVVGWQMRSLVWQLHGQVQLLRQCPVGLSAASAKGGAIQNTSTTSTTICRLYTTRPD